jgi:hypothetical protein
MEKRKFKSNRLYRGKKHSHKDIINEPRTGCYENKDKEQRDS